MKFEAVLFDLDGTLIDTIDDIGNAVNRVLLNKGFPTHTISTFRRFIGDGARILLARSLPKKALDEHLLDICLKEFIEDYSHNFNVKTKCYNGIHDLLDELKRIGLKLAVLSNKPDPITKNCVKSLLSNWEFDIVFGQRDSVPRKPNPQGALEVAKKLSISPTHFLFLGDTGVDMKTAVSAKMFPVGALWGFRTLKELKENGARAVIEAPLKLLDLL
jgi:phosphoglycolate phosphatase